jgi:hypothetical protein
MENVNMQGIERPKDLISLSEARLLIGVSRLKMGQLVKDGHLETYADLLDRRVKLVSRAEVLGLKIREKAA